MAKSSILYAIVVVDIMCVHAKCGLFCTYSLQKLHVVNLLNLIVKWYLLILYHAVWKTVKTRLMIDLTGGSVQRPRGPPPPAPISLPPSRLSNGQSTESISSITSDLESTISSAQLNPVPPPRKVNIPSILVMLLLVKYMLR